MTEHYVPNELARKLDVSGLTFRNWLRSQAEAGNPILSDHEYRRHYKFSKAEAESLTKQFRAERNR